MQTQAFTAKPGALTGVFLPLFRKFYEGYVGEAVLFERVSWCKALGVVFSPQPEGRAAGAVRAVRRAGGAGHHLRPLQRLLAGLQ